MSVAFTFPGQGSQAVGMGKALADEFSVARAVYEEVNDALGEKLSDIMWNGPADVLTLTRNAQPALMAASIAALRVMKEKGLDLADKVSYVAGHSLGEYSALAASGALSLGDTARLLRIRGDAMQKAVPVGEGAMAAILGLSMDDVKAVTKEAADGEVCQVANDNATGQVVISGAKSAIERAAALAKEKGAKRALLLPVSAPFHCALMAPAADAMADALSKVTIHKPAVPLVANVLANAIDDPEAIRKHLVEQVTGMVRWSESVSWLSHNGVDCLYEIGTGKVLSGLAKRIVKGISTVNVGEPGDIDPAMAKLA
ncbi:[Acyl-carrier-protein] S-malonyltransferase [Cohaesibacter marisflavi]|uniref:Malonyl CoA-acyl carrier protein transacylase n=1 Tax=Cohaesibacter marisflavi TaxID=655353 RepID=A0A1I5FWQ2_9HYPH|nr:ACP S-malonyltransferase [Cohaesibacter marisflavi]SFO28172.1 [Acyl-carrier-protein] S-malonyltransferase [Cohaesibacter marisflavi]